MRYRPIFSDSAVEFLATLPRRRQRKLLDRVQELADDPFLVPDFRRRDEDDREISHILIDDFLFNFWTDHATKVVMIVEIEDAS
jgi:mRNA-degrading endonuclease RelE of RelBE toxin-antitoxin system